MKRLPTLIALLFCTAFSILVTDLPTTDGQSSYTVQANENMLSSGW